MPQPNQNSLINVLLMWTIILSIIQGVFIVLFFTTGRPDQPPPSEDSFPPGEMLFFQFAEVDGQVKWQGKNRTNTAVLAQGKDLEIRRSGHYFLNLQVTLFPECAECRGPPQTECEVRLFKHGTECLIKGWMNANTCSTGRLGTVAELSAGDRLSFLFNVSLGHISQSQSLTHLAIIMFERQSG